jgi:predicted component of type VI protein secretion system
MRKHLLSCLVLLAAIIGCNKKEKSDPEPVIEEIKVTELTDPDFI